MQKNLFLLASILILFSCKKNDDSTGSNPGDEDDCVMRVSSGNGEIGATQYVVAFSPYH